MANVSRARIAALFTEQRRSRPDQDFGAPDQRRNGYSPCRAARLMSNCSRTFNAPLRAFMDRTAQAGDPLEQGNRPANEQALLRRILVYNASVLEIATGPFPEVNALDMLVFAMLGKGALERHWIPQRFGEEGAPLVEAFTCLERDSWDTAVKFLDRQQQADLRELVSAWQYEHPDQYRVEGVRFQEFSEHAGQIEDARTKKARGLLGQVQSATMAADQALVISERAFFVAHRMPFLIRLQARLGVQETLSDASVPIGRRGPAAPAGARDAADAGGCRNVDQQRHRRRARDASARRSGRATLAPAHHDRRAARGAGHRQDVGRRQSIDGAVAVARYASSVERCPTIHGDRSRRSSSAWIAC